MVVRVGVVVTFLVGMVIVVVIGMVVEVGVVVTLLVGMVIVVVIGMVVEVGVVVTLLVGIGERGRGRDGACGRVGVRGCGPYCGCDGSHVQN